MNNKTRYICLTGLFIALVTIVTTFVRVPISFTGGYKNLGDAIIFLSALFFNPLICFFIGGVGSALADLLTGYAHYALISLVVKGIEGLIIGLIYQRYIKKKDDNLTPFLIGSVISSIWMCLGYFLSNYIFYNSFEVSASGIPGNLLQAAVCVVAACLLFIALKPLFNKLRIK